MTEHASISTWFPEPMSDEAAFAVHLFLEQFACQFESAYYAQIRRHIESQRLDLQQQQSSTDGSPDLPWEDDPIPF